MIRLFFGMWVLLSFSGCPGSRDLPPPPADEPKLPDGPTCGAVFRDPTVRGGGGCCIEPTAALLTSSDVVAACGRPAASYLGQTRDGTACRLHFRAEGADADPRQTYVMVSRPIVPVGVAAPVRPNPLLGWAWEKVPLRDALGYEATAAGSEPGLLERQTVLWAGRGRRIVGLQVSKKICDETGARALLQKALDAVPGSAR